jgi:hypothetical protein
MTINLNKPDYAGKSASELIEIFEAQIAALRQKRSPMKVKDLIAALQAQSVNPDAEVHVWLDGVHYTINAEVPVDPWGEDGMFVDINLKED